MLLPLECERVHELMTILKACSAEREALSPGVFVLPREMLSLAHGGVGLSVAQQLLCGCTPLHTLCGEQPVNPTLSLSQTFKVFALALK